MVVVRVVDLDNDTFLEGFENNEERFYINIGFNTDEPYETRFNTLDVGDAKFLIEKLSEFVNNNNN
jgi:hypothetical protein